MLSGISTGCPGNIDVTAPADRENGCNCEYGGVYMCAESVNNADVSTSSIGGGRGNSVDVIALADRENVYSGWRDDADISASSLAGWSRNVGVRGGIIDVIANCAPAVSGRKRGKVCGSRRDGVSEWCANPRSVAADG